MLTGHWIIDTFAIIGALVPIVWTVVAVMPDPTERFLNS